MKKISILLIVLCVMFGVSGCKKGEEEKTKEITFSLYSNSSTGYIWFYEVDQEGIIKIEGSYDSGSCPDDVEGCGGKEVYHITGLKEGKVTLSMRYQFNNDESKVESTAIYEFTVDKDLNITETHSGTYFDKNK